MPTATLARPVRDAPAHSVAAMNMSIASRGMDLVEPSNRLIASAGLTLDAALGPVDLVVIERAHRGQVVTLTLAEAAHLLGLLPEDLGLLPDGQTSAPADVRDARIRRARASASCSNVVIRRAEHLIGLYLRGTGPA